ncbi:hypothetical protein [Actinomadura livida]|uniref:Uncharacterized protein n=1 Tax=Actinomadura livida TaxID=79909 RepID=A0A7W7IKB1_9ACTN|nr:MULTISPECIES: hypothetical protein [Actinomadura]MBB4778674.1 hypothetical protein [Actinomadura catellatispora]GGU30727.1 hypothetical protein GCM10010208_64400 [Actinomadura livida]
MTVVLVLLCLAIAGRELYLAFERKRSPGAPEIADIRTQLRALKGTRDELEGFRAAQRERLDALAREQDSDREALGEADARIRSLIAQINDRMVPDVNDRLNRQREAADLQRETVERLAAEVAGIRAHLVGRLDQAVAASLGAGPADVVAGSLTARPPAGRHGLTGPYEGFAERHGLRVELTDGDRYYLSGRSPRALEHDFLDLVRGLCANRADSFENVRPLLDALRDTGRGTARLGPLLVVRTPESVVCGVLPLAELLRPESARILDDPESGTRRLRRLPHGRVCDLTASSGRAPSG